MFKKLLCNMGIHWLENHSYNFRDNVSGKSVYDAECSVCGDRYMVDSLIPFLGFRVENSPEEG